MITPYLESLIAKGKARWHNYAGGYAGLYTILCPDSKTIVLTDINICLPPTYAQNSQDLSLVIQSLSLNISEAFIFRAEGGSEPIDPAVIPISVYKDLYIVSSEDLRLRFLTINTPFSAIDFITTLPESQEPPMPNGYGANASNRDISFTTDLYLPLGNKYTRETISVLATAKNQPVPDVSAASIIPVADSPYLGFVFNIGYVTVEKKSYNSGF